MANGEDVGKKDDADDTIEFDSSQLEAPAFHEIPLRELKPGDTVTLVTRHSSYTVVAGEPDASGLRATVTRRPLNTGGEEKPLNGDGPVWLVGSIVQGLDRPAESLYLGAQAVFIYPRDGEWWQ